MELEQKQQSARSRKTTNQPDQNMIDVEQENISQSAMSELDEVEEQLLEEDEKRARLEGLAALYPLMMNKGIISKTSEEAGSELEGLRQTPGE